MLLLASGAGCQLASVAVYKTVGPPAVPATYVMTKEPTLVLAENYKSPGSPFVDATQLTRFTGEELLKRDIVPVVDSTKLYDLQQKEGTNFRKMSITAIGRAVGAKQVLYLDVTRASMENIGAEMSRGGLDVSVKVIDVATGETRWPQSTSAGYPLTAQTSFQKTTENLNEMAIREAVSRSMAVNVVKLFRAVKSDEE